MEMIDIAICVNGWMKETVSYSSCRKSPSPQSFLFALVSCGKSNFNKINSIYFRKSNAEITQCSLSIHYRQFPRDAGVRPQLRKSSIISQSGLKESLFKHILSLDFPFEWTMNIISLWRNTMQRQKNWVLQSATYLKMRKFFLDL